MHFNSHPHKEDDGRWLYTIFLGSLFQLTSSQGGWLVFFFLSSSSASFISTHILTRRMTVSAAIVASVSCPYFNSHPHKEDDLLYMGVDEEWLYFNSHPHKEDDHTKTVSENCGIIFQLTSSQGGWRYSSHVLPLKILFQLTSSQGGWPGKIPNSWMKVVFQLTSSQGGWRIT